MKLSNFLNWFECGRVCAKEEEMLILFNGLTMYYGKYGQHQSYNAELELDADNLQEYFKNAVIFICEQQGDDLTRFSREIESNQHKNIDLSRYKPFIKEAIVRGIEEGYLEAKQRMENKSNISSHISIDRPTFISSAPPSREVSESSRNVVEQNADMFLELSTQAKNLLRHCVGGSSNCWPSFFGGNMLDSTKSKKELTTEGVHTPSIMESRR